jgi:hypothetical protein
MYARAVDTAQQQLRELRQEERCNLGLAAVVLAASIAATEALPALAVPLFLGGLFVGAMGTRAMWRRWDLVEQLAGERDAYVISEVFAFASREATMERRLSFAALIRGRLEEARHVTDARVLCATDDLEALASELEDERLALEPASAVACMRLLSDVLRSPLLNQAVPSEDLRSRVLQIRSGFAPRELPAVEVPRQVEPATSGV